MPEQTTTPPPPTPSEEEALFRRTVRAFAERAVRPRVAAMEQSASLDRALLAQCFQLGLMGIEIPEALGGAGGSMLMTVLAVEELSAVGAALALFVGGQKTLVKQLLIKWGGGGVHTRFLSPLPREPPPASPLSHAPHGF